MVKNIGFDKILLITMICLILLGLIMIYSSTMILAKENHEDSFYYLKRQLLFMGMGLVLFTIIATLRHPIYLNQHFVFFVLLVCIVGLVLVFFTGKINNSYRWIRILGFSIQPSEFAKIGVVMYLAYMFGKKNPDVNNLKTLSITLIPIFIVELLILKEPDYGSFFLILFISMVLLFMSGLKLLYIFIATASFIPLGYLLLVINPMRMNRIMAFLNPEKFGDSLNFQVIQSLNAIGSGGIFGQGLGNSTQKLYFLPYAYSDFIFAIIGEEVGLIGALFVIILFWVYLRQGIIIAKHSGSRHSYLLVVSLTFMLVFQAMMNISVTLGILPTKGIPLPFISLGGSSLIASFIVTGIIVNVSRHRKTVLLND